MQWSRLAGAWAAALIVSALAGCSDHQNPAAPDSGSASDNLVRACGHGINAIEARLPHNSPGDVLVPDTATVNIGASTRVWMTLNDTPLVDRVLSGVLPPMYGQDFLATNGSSAYAVDYVAPACEGTDSLWYLVDNGSGGRDTGLVVIHIGHPTIGRPDSVDVVSGQTLTSNNLPTAFDAQPVWMHARVVGFAGSSRGARSSSGDSLFTYVAPTSYAGVDSVRVIYEADYEQLIIRDTTLERFDVLPRPAPPGPYDVTPIAAPGMTVTASGLSSDGKVAGTAVTATGEHHAFSWIAGAFTDLGTYNGAPTYGVGINAAGDVAGYAQTGDSTTQALEWMAIGSVSPLAAGKPAAPGVSDAGVVVVIGPDNSYWRTGAFVRQVGGSVVAVTNDGKVLTCYPDMYQSCELVFPDGGTTLITLGHGTFPVVLNDSADVWVYGSGGNGYYDTFFEHVREGAVTYQRTLNSVFPELVPNGTDTRFGTQTRLAMDNHRDVLETNILITTRGAFAIGDYVADKNWQIVKGVAMNDRGQILAVAQNSATGFTGPVLLTPQNTLAATHRRE